MALVKRLREFLIVDEFVQPAVDALVIMDLAAVVSVLVSLLFR